MTRATTGAERPELERVLGQYLAVQAPPDLPELRLWLLGGHVDLNARCAELLEGGYAPYWAFCWSGGQALARYVLDHPDWVRGQRVVDFGAGSGVVAIAAKKAGAAIALAIDSDPKARYFAALNAELNGVEIEVLGALPERFDLLVASDVFYDLEATAVVQRALRGGARALIADPGRPGSYRPSSPPLAWLASRTFPDVDYPVASAALYALGGAADVGADTASR